MKTSNPGQMNGCCLAGSRAVLLSLGVLCGTGRWLFSCLLCLLCRGAGINGCGWWWLWWYHTVVGRPHPLCIHTGIRYRARRWWWWWWRSGVANVTTAVYSSVMFGDFRKLKISNYLKIRKITFRQVFPDGRPVTGLYYRLLTSLTSRRSLVTVIMIPVAIRQNVHLLFQA